MVMSTILSEKWRSGGDISPHNPSPGSMPIGHTHISWKSYLVVESSTAITQIPSFALEIKGTKPHSYYLVTHLSILTGHG